ncbi:prolipoprotein diacylglyceryl transferase [Tessaracoccus terricola]
MLTFPDIDPVAINIFGLKIHWYAIMYLIGFAVAYILLRRRLKHEPYRSITKPEKWTPADIEDLLLYAIAGVIVGGRLGYVLFYKPSFYLANPLDIIKLWDGGMSFHGGAIGVIVGIAVHGLIKKRPFLQVADFLVPAVPFGLMAGRIGNFINGELWGREASADLPWAMIFPTGGDVPRHPSQIYQALLEGLLLFVLLWLYARKPRFRGQVAGAFLFGYGAFRFIGEFWREPDSYLGLLGGGLSMGQWLSVPMVVAGLIIWTWSRTQAISDVEAGGDEATGDAQGEGEPASDPDGSAEPMGDKSSEPEDETSDDIANAPEGAPETTVDEGSDPAEVPEEQR